MSTPYRPDSSKALNTGPSCRVLQQLLEEINRGTSPREVSSKRASRSLTQTRSRSSSQLQSSSVWIGGSALALDAREKLRAADEARRQMTAANTIDGSPDCSTPTQRLDTSRSELHISTAAEHKERRGAELHQSLDPVGQPHNYAQHMMESSPLSTPAEVLPAMQRHNNTPSHPQAAPFGSFNHEPLSPLIFSGVFLDDSSSMSSLTEETASPTEAPTSAATVYTADLSHTPEDVRTCKRVHSLDDIAPEGSIHKRRTVTLPEIGGAGYFDVKVEAPRAFPVVGGDSQCLLWGEAFVERACTASVLDMPTNDAPPELSSFRPIDAGPQRQSRLGTPIPNLTRASTGPVRDTPAWMRPLHLIDTGGRSIYKNVHDDGPIRHALCLWCFRTHGDFHKVHRYGYESCGRAEVLDSHYWEDDTWPDSSDDESPSSH
ncbi:hypothetical protein C7974DRAFT_453644 [Boeremia exigua]|uniref:uncharacterized protein n=1 Tax=Boeremia exigua TaxID=749465 RepID=UPI001E8EB6F2|nr:uncharacterized protein C7974DRAFT_453644 [Boeremia exigua]KAH6629079.1 hypothetical protein C7974DRAFT_453644 [Boeremia exigua]